MDVIKLIRLPDADGIAVYAVKAGADLTVAIDNAPSPAERIALMESGTLGRGGGIVATVVAVKADIEEFASETVSYQWGSDALVGKFVCRNPAGGNDVMTYHNDLPSAVEDAADVAVWKLHSLIHKRDMIERRDAAVAAYFSEGNKE